MASVILECPACEHRFNFENNHGKFPENINCPSCGKVSAREDFLAVMLCANCSTNLKLSLNIFNGGVLACPKCNTQISTGNISLDEKFTSGFASEDEIRIHQSSQMIQDGEIFDKFRIIRQLGKGGMAEVYLAEHILLKQLCALKLMRNTDASRDPVYIKRFLREAKLSHQLNHQNIVKMYEVGSDFKTGYFFIAMEYVEGPTLLEMVNEELLSEEDLKILLYSMASALKCLDEAKVVHRDIKPSNIMLDKNGIFKLMDLGIAKAETNRQSGEMTLTMEQSAIGTPSYASPEQCQSSHSVDIRSDIYSLGATLYHAASGKLPFDGATAVEIILKVLKGNPEPLRNMRPDLSADFLQLVEQMMKKNPEERPASPEMILDSLSLTDGMVGEIKRIKVKKGSGSFWKALLPSQDVPLSKYMMRVLRVIFGLILLVAIILNLQYIFNYYKDKNPGRKSSGNPPAKTIPVRPSFQIRQTGYMPVKNKNTVKNTPRTQTPDQSSKTQNDDRITEIPSANSVTQEEKSSSSPQPQRQIQSVTPQNDFSADSAENRKNPPFVFDSGADNRNYVSSGSSSREILDDQLQYSREKYKKFQNHHQKLQAEKQKLTNKMSETRASAFNRIYRKCKDLIRTWSSRLHQLERRNRDIAAVRSRTHSKAAGREVQQTFQNYTEKKKYWGYNHDDVEFSRKFQQMIKKDSVDPNIMVVDSSHQKYSGALLFSLMSDRIAEEEKLIKILVERKVDPSVLTAASNRFNVITNSGALIEYGLPRSVLQNTLDFLLVLSNVIKIKYVRENLPFLLMDGATPGINHLKYAISMNDKEILTLLLAMGADPDEKDNNDETALFHAYRSVIDDEIFDLLLAAGADPDIRNNDGKVARDFNHVGRFLRDWGNKNMRVCRNALANGMNPNVNLNNGHSLLVDACIRSDLEAVELLLRYKADPNLTDARRTYPLIMAINQIPRNDNPSAKEMQKVEIIKKLLKAGAEPAENTLRHIIYNFARFRYGREIFLEMLKSTKHLEYRDWIYIFSGFSYRANFFSAKEKKEIRNYIPDEMVSGELLFHMLFSGIPVSVSKIRNEVTPAMLQRQQFLNNIGSVPLLCGAVSNEQPVEIIRALLEKDPNWQFNAQRAITYAKSEEIRRLLQSYRPSNRQR